MFRLWIQSLLLRWVIESRNHLGNFSIRYPNFLIFQRAVNSIMNYYMNSTVVLRIQLHIVMYLGYTRIRFYQNWPRDYGLLSPPILFIRRFDFLLLLLQLLGWGILFLYKKLQKYIKEKYFSWPDYDNFLKIKLAPFLKVWVSWKLSIFFGTFLFEKTTHCVTVSIVSLRW